MTGDWLVSLAAVNPIIFMWRAILQRPVFFSFPLNRSPRVAS